MRRIWPRLSPFRVLGVIRPLLLLVAVGASGIIVACQGPEPFRLDVILPDTGGTAVAGNPGTGGKVGTGGITVATGGRATGGITVATGGITVATGGRATGGITVATGGRVSNTGGMPLAGSSGSAGTGGTGAGGIPGACAATTTEKVIVSLKAGAQSGGTNALAFSVLNAGNADIKLSNLKLRYYFKPASTAAPSAFVYEIDNITGNVKTLVTSAVGATAPTPTTSTGADDYLELSFATTAPALSPASSFLIEGRLHDKAYAVGFTPAMDYSYVLSTTYVKAPKVVASLVTATGSCVLAGVPPS